jgi:hypothetical protein
MSDYPTKEECERCEKSSFSKIMSMYSEEWICMDCKQEETKRLDYEEAVARDVAEYMSRVYAHHPQMKGDYHG